MPYRYPLMIPIPFSLQVAGTAPTSFITTSNFCQAANGGIQFLVTVEDQNGNPINLMGASNLVIAFQSPDGTQFTRAAQLYTNGIDGIVAYTTTPSDLTEAGLWYLQAQATVGGSPITTAWGQFQVGANL